MDCEGIIALTWFVGCMALMLSYWVTASRWRRAFKAHMGDDLSWRDAVMGTQGKQLTPELARLKLHGRIAFYGFLTFGVVGLLFVMFLSSSLCN